MSIILEGIDLPNSGEIELIIRPHGKVLSNTRGIYAEAIQIPKGARLIDANLFKETIKDSVPSWAIGVKIPTYGDMDIMDKIYRMPTIFESEEE